MSGICPSRIWDCLDETSLEFVRYLGKHPGSPHYQFTQDTGKVVGRADFRKMIQHGFFTATGKIRAYKSGWVNVYTLTSKAEKVLVEKEKQAGF